MVVKRKKKTIDAIDREIIRSLHTARRNLTGNQISKKVNITSSAIAPRLRNLKLKGIIREMQKQKPRVFERTFKTGTKKISAPRSIFWGLDMKPSRKRKK